MAAAAGPRRPRAARRVAGQDPHQRAGGSLRRLGLLQHLAGVAFQTRGGAHRSRVEGVKAQRAAGTAFLRPLRRHDFKRGLADAVGTLKRLGDAAADVGHVQHATSRCGAQQRQAVTGQGKAGGEVHLQRLQPVLGLDVFHAGEGLEVRSRQTQHVEAPEMGVHLGQIAPVGAGEIEGIDRRLGTAGRDDGVER